MRSRGSGRRRLAADEALVRSVYEQHGRALLAYATRLLGERHAAEDVVQETLVRAWRNPEVLVNGKGSVRGWLLTVARTWSSTAHGPREARPAEVAEEAAGSAATTADHAESVVDSVVVLEALDQLSDEHRDVLVEVYLKGSSVAQAADTLGIPPGTVRSRSFYALRALRAWAGQGGVLEAMTR